MTLTRLIVTEYRLLAAGGVLTDSRSEVFTETLKRVAGVKPRDRQIAGMETWTADLRRQRDTWFNMYAVCSFL